MGWPRRARTSEPGELVWGRREWVSRAVPSWQAIGHARRMGGSFPRAGGGAESGGSGAGGSCPPWVNQV